LGLGIRPLKHSRGDFPPKPLFKEKVHFPYRVIGPAGEAFFWGGLPISFTLFLVPSLSGGFKILFPLYWGLFKIPGFPQKGIGFGPPFLRVWGFKLPPIFDKNFFRFGGLYIRDVKSFNFDFWALLLVGPLGETLQKTSAENLFWGHRFFPFFHVWVCGPPMF